MPHIAQIFPLCSTTNSDDIELGSLGFGWGSCQTPDPQNVVGVLFDGNLTTKHVSLGPMGGDTFIDGKGVNTGFVLVFRGARSAVLEAFQFGTSDDDPRYDPSTVKIQGSVANDLLDAAMGSSWRLVYNGSTGIDEKNDPGRCEYGVLQSVHHLTAYKIYRILVTSQRGRAIGVQYSEVRLFGYFIN